MVGAWDAKDFGDGSKRKPWSQAPSFARLAAWRDGLPDLPGRAAELAAAEGEDGFDDADGVRWRFPALDTSPPLEPLKDAGAASGEIVIDPAEAARRLRERCEEARARMAIPVSRRASDDAPHADREERAEGGRAASPASAAGRDARRLAGVAVHRILEELDLSLPVAEALAAGRARLPEVVAAQADEEAREAAHVHALAILDRLEQSEGAVLARLAGLDRCCIARELPVLLPPEGGEVAGFVVGTLDLVYREAESDRIVVADYKTDEIDGAAAVEDKKRQYAGQGAVYQRALREALGLDYTPRFELWMLWSGDVVVAG
jgi:ATP-dependent exoDNAse (exonuclease V) beta subunit